MVVQPTGQYQEADAGAIKRPQIPAGPKDVDGEQHGQRDAGRGTSAAAKSRAQQHRRTPNKNEAPKLKTAVTKNRPGGPKDDFVKPLKIGNALTGNCVGERFGRTELSRAHDQLAGA